MRALLLVVVLAAGAAQAQLGGGFGGSTPSTGGTGVTVVASLGTCASPNVGALQWLSPSSALYVCDGSTWRQAWTSREGTVGNADVYLPAYSVVLQAAAGDYAIRVNNRAKVDFGDGPTDECVSTGGKVSCNSWTFGDVSTDVLANKTTNGNITISLARYFRILPTGNQSCSASDSGGLKAASADGNRPVWCDGTAVYRMSRVVESAVTVDVASIAAQSCLTTSVTVTGAAAGDTLWANADFALPLGVLVGNVRTTAANTVELTLCNVTAGALDPASGSYRFRIER